MKPIVMRNDGTSDEPMNAYKAYRLEKMLRSAKADKMLEALLPVLIVTWLATVCLVVACWLNS